MIRGLFLAAYIALVTGVCEDAFAASAAVSGLTKGSSGYSFKSPTATAANGAFNMSANVVSGGRQITMPATATFAANAASFAVTAVRLNPAGLMVGLTAQWLLGQGLQWGNNMWTKQVPAQNYNWEGYASIADAVAAICSGQSAPNQLRVDGVYLAYPGALTQAEAGNNVEIYCGWSYQRTIWKMCTATNTQYQQGCAPAGNTAQPATEADFAAAGAGAISDGAAQELARADVALPVNEPVLAPAAVDSYGTPFLDVASGRMLKELTRVTPDPTPNDPLNVRVDRYQVDAGNVPGQTSAPEAAPKQATNMDFPSDYARQGEAKSAAELINATLGPKLDKITETGADPADPLQPQNSEFDQAFFQGTFTNLLGWQLPAHTSQCPTSAFSWNGQSFTIDSHCQMVQDHFSGLSAVMTVVWSILALFVLLGA